MTFLRVHRLAGFLAASAAFASMAVSGELPTAFVLPYAGALLLALVLGDRTAGKLEGAWTVGLVAAALFLVGEAVIGNLDFVVAMALIVALLALNRLFNRRTVRDDALLHLTSLLMLAAGAALSAELAYGACFALFAVFATWSLTLSHLREAIEDGSAEEGAAALLGSRQLVTPGLLGALGALSAAALVGAAMVFVFFPRVTLGALQRHGGPGARVGFGDTVDLSAHGRIKDDPRVALRVRLNPAPPDAPLTLHWRGRAFDGYDGRTWSRSGTSGRKSFHRQVDGMFAVDQLPRGAAKVTQDIDLLPGVTDDVLLFAGRAESVRSPMGLAPYPGEIAQLYRDGGDDLLFGPPTSAEVHYSVVAAPEDSGAVYRGRGSDYPIDVAARDLQTPPAIDLRVRALADRLARENPDPYDRALATITELASRAYSLDPQPETKDPLARFLFESRAGHCELFSTAMAVLLRLSGVPTRNVTGFYGGIPIHGAGYWVVREGDAHSWVEVYFPGAGWVLMDPTPESARSAQAGGLAERWALFSDAMTLKWRRYVVEYDLRSQVEAAMKVGAALHGLSERLGGKRGKGQLKDALLRLVAVLVGLAALGGAAFAVRRSLRRRGAPLPRGPSTAAVRRARKLDHALRKALARSGVASGPATTATELAEAARQHRLAIAPAAQRAAERYLEARFGGGELSSAELAEHVEALEPLRHRP